MAIFTSYVKLPEGTLLQIPHPATICAPQYKILKDTDSCPNSISRKGTHIYMVCVCVWMSPAVSTDAAKCNQSTPMRRCVQFQGSLQG